MLSPCWDWPSQNSMLSRGSASPAEGNPDPPERPWTRRQSPTHHRDQGVWRAEPELKLQAGPQRIPVPLGSASGPGFFPGPGRVFHSTGLAGRGRRRARCAGAPAVAINLSAGPPSRSSGARALGWPRVPGCAGLPDLLVTALGPPTPEVTRSQARSVPFRQREETASPPRCHHSILTVAGPRGVQASLDHRPGSGLIGGARNPTKTR